MTGKVVLITGAARGQGRAHAARLSADGADTILVDIAGPLPPSVPYDSATPEDLAQTADLVVANDRRAVTAIVDTRDHDALCAAVDKAVAELGRLDVIVANAGICCPAPGTGSPQRFSGHHQHQPGRDLEHGHGRREAHHRRWTWRIDHSDRIGGGVKMEPFMVAYTASKHGVTGLAKSFAVELGRYDIRVNSLHPGSVATPMGSGRMIEAMQEAAESYSHPQYGFSKQLIPNAVTMPEDVANAVAWLASDESRFVTAAAISVDVGVAQA